MKIYLKPSDKTTLTGRKLVYLKDLAEVYSTDIGKEDLEKIVVFTIKNDEKKTYLISYIDIIRNIFQTYPSAEIENVGSSDTIIEYNPVSKKDSKLILNLKIIFITIVIFFGAATAIISFHYDGEMSRVLQGFYYIFFGENVEHPYILEIPYSLGLAVGIIVFFNHFSKIHLTQDPTPIEVQMSTYESETIGSIKSLLSKKEESNKRKPESYKEGK